MEEERRDEDGYDPESAALAIQSAWRCFKARKNLHAERSTWQSRCQSVWFTEAATLIQKHYRGHRVRRIVSSGQLIDLEQPRHKRLAATRIQAAWRGHHHRLSLIPRLKYWKAVHALQRSWRGFLARRELRAKRADRQAALNASMEEQREEAAIAIQHVWRGRRRLLAAQTIQLAWWSCLARRRAAERRSLRDAQRKEEQMEVYTECAVAIQKCWRGAVARWAVRWERQQRRARAAIKVQKVFRAARGRVLMEEARREKVAEGERIMQSEGATRIQALWRGWSVREGMRAAREEIFREFADGAVKVQALFRSYISRKHGNTLENARWNKTHGKYATAIQKGWRGAQSRRLISGPARADRAAALEAEQELAAGLALQSWFRGVKDRKRAAELAHRRGAARRIQGWWIQRQPCITEIKERNHLRREARRAAKFEWATAAAIVVQRATRIQLARSERKRRQRLVDDALSALEAASLERYSATGIQKVVRGWIHRRRMAAAAKIQSIYRMRKAQRQAVRKRGVQERLSRNDLEWDAATMIQRLVRGHQERQRHIMRHAQHCYHSEAASIMQRCVRSGLAQRKLNRYKAAKAAREKEEVLVGAIINIQRLFRGFVDRRINLFPLVLAAAKIQRRWKIRKSRERLATLRFQRAVEVRERREKNAAIMLQKVWKGALVRVRDRKRKWEESQAGTRLRRKIWAAEIIQRIGRGHTARTETRPRLTNALAAQLAASRFAKAHLSELRARRLDLHHRTERAAVLIQQAWRSFLVARDETFIHTELYGIAAAGLMREERGIRQRLRETEGDGWKDLRDAFAAQRPMDDPEAGKSAARLPNPADVTHPLPPTDTMEKGLFLTEWMEFLWYHELEKLPQFEMLLAKESRQRRRIEAGSRQLLDELHEEERKIFTAHQSALRSANGKRAFRTWINQQQQEKKAAAMHTMDLKRSLRDRLPSSASAAHRPPPAALAAPPSAAPSAPRNGTRSSLMQHINFAATMPSPTKAQDPHPPVAADVRQLAPLRSTVGRNPINNRLPKGHRSSRSAAAGLAAPASLPPLEARADTFKPGGKFSRALDAARGTPQAQEGDVSGLGVAVDARSCGLTDGQLGEIVNAYMNTPSSAYPAEQSASILLLSGNNITDAGAGVLFKLLSSSRCRVVGVDLTNNPGLGEWGGMNLLSALQSNTELKFLRLEGTGVSALVQADVQRLLMAPGGAFPPEITGTNDTTVWSEALLAAG